DLTRLAYSTGIGRFFNFAAYSLDLACPSSPRRSSGVGPSVTVTTFSPAAAPGLPSQVSLNRPWSSVTPVAIALPFNPAAVAWNAPRACGSGCPPSITTPSASTPSGGFPPPPHPAKPAANTTNTQPRRIGNPPCLSGSVRG